MSKQQKAIVAVTAAILGIVSVCYGVYDEEIGWILLGMSLS